MDGALQQSFGPHRQGRVAHKNKQPSIDTVFVTVRTYTLLQFVIHQFRAATSPVHSGSSFFFCTAAVTPTSNTLSALMDSQDLCHLQSIQMIRKPALCVSVCVNVRHCHMCDNFRKTYYDKERRSDEEKC